MCVSGKRQLWEAGLRKLLAGDDEAVLRTPVSARFRIFVSHSSAATSTPQASAFALKFDRSLPMYRWMEVKKHPTLIGSEKRVPLHE
jgi:hypothetical protein